MLKKVDDVKGAGARKYSLKNFIQGPIISMYFYAPAERKR